MIDEEPSQEDIEQFSDNTAHCLYCGAEVYDDCLECPACKTTFTTPSLPHKMPIKIDLANKVGVLLVILLLLSFFWDPITSFLGL